MAGSLFFDEVGDMPLGTQSKILRVLVDQSFQRVGGVDKVRVDIRVISNAPTETCAKPSMRAPSGRSYITA